jgi:hypothetical protein
LITLWLKQNGFKGMLALWRCGVVAGDCRLSAGDGKLEASGPYDFEYEVYEVYEVPHFTLGT